ncbi:MAG: hypothetical protein ACLQGV_05470 [Bryobacteraceae bacterium]
MPSKSLLLAIALAAPALAGPVEFGMAEVQRAIAARGIKPGMIRFNTDISTDAPETFRILPGSISGGDLRGLMYGLLEAADQIRATGWLAMAKGTPAMPIRGVRYVASGLDQQTNWPEYFALLARSRFNRFHLVLTEPISSLSRQLETLRSISQAASDHGLDFILGIQWESAESPNYDVLAKALGFCPAIRGLELRTDSQPSSDALFRVLRQAGRRVTLDLPAGPLPEGFVEAAQAARVPLVVALRYWAGEMGRPYQPAETSPGFSYFNLLERPRPYGCYWSLGSARFLLWGDPDFVRRAAATFTLSDSGGFEIDAPAERGFDRYWLFYMLWGRIGYDPKAPDKLWTAELKRRFGAAAPDVLEAYRTASGVLPEIVAAWLPDPNESVWPETSPGGLLDAYRDAWPSDGRFIVSVSEAVHNRLQGLASAMQTPWDTAELLRDRAAKIEAALARVQAKLAAGHPEWRDSQPDFQALALLASYHAHKMLAFDQVAYFDQTGDPAALEAAHREIAAAIPVWEKLAALDIGPWRDKLLYVRHDLKLIEEREKIFQQFGRFDFGFDFGGPAQTRQLSYRSDVAPRFQAVDPATRYTEAAGFGWLGEGERTAHALPLTPYLEVRGVAPNPRWLPSNALYGDWIRGHGPQTFRIRAADGLYSVLVLQTDGSATPQKLRARNGFLDVLFSEPEFAVSGLVVKGPRAAEPLPARKELKRLPRPNIAHVPPKTAPPDKPLALAVRIFPVANVKAVRLHYRPVNQLAKFKTLENPGAKGVFTIPAADLSRRWDLMYYFEILNKENTGWFDPDPRAATPYYVVPIEAAPPNPNPSATPPNDLSEQEEP